MSGDLNSKKICYLGYRPKQQNVTKLKNYVAINGIERGSKLPIPKQQNLNKKHGKLDL